MADARDGGRGCGALRVAFLVGAMLAGNAAEARRPVGEMLTPDQAIVVADAVNDTFPSPRRARPPMALCLDVQLAPLALDAEPPPAPRPRRGGRAKEKPPEPKPPIVRGAPPELVARLARPWRTVVSALDCKLDPGAPYTLDDGPLTPAQLVRVYLTEHVATGALRIEWSSAAAIGLSTGNSRDCRATRTRTGWSVRCGGTWTQ